MVTQLNPICAAFDFTENRILTHTFFSLLIILTMTLNGCMQNENHSLSLEDLVTDSVAMNQQSRPNGASDDRDTDPAQTTPSKSADHHLENRQVEKFELDESDPAAVCLSFMRELHLGNKIAAENLLSRTALAVIGREQLDLSPIGSEQSEFEIMDVRFASVKQEVAYVECRVIDGDHLDETAIWLLKQQNKKWRISGMIQTTSGGTPRMISFENPVDVAALQQ